ncbi:MAG TPA: hypothetical protein VGB95_00500 [Chitinophagales bacterium]
MKNNFENCQLSGETISFNYSTLGRTRGLGEIKIIQSEDKMTIEILLNFFLYPVGFILLSGNVFYIAYNGKEPMFLIAIPILWTLYGLLYLWTTRSFKSKIKETIAFALTGIK